MPLGVVKNGKKIYCYIKNEHVTVTFVNLIFRNFAWNDDVKSFFGIVGTSWMGWGWVEWDWHMGMSYFTSLNPQLFRNIAYVGFFKHVSVQLFSHVFCNSTKTITNSSDHPPAHYLYQQVSKTHIFVEFYKQAYINVKLIDPRSHLW